MPTKYISQHGLRCVRHQTETVRNAVPRLAPATFAQAFKRRTVANLSCRMLRLEDIESSAQVSSNWNASCGNRRTTDRRTARNTTCGNLSKSPLRSQHM